MAELNVFRTITKTVGGTSEAVYTAPANYTGIVLSTQVTNASDSDHTLTMTYHDSVGATGVELLSQFTIPGRDTAAATTGKLVITTGSVVKMEASQTDKLKAVIGILESQNG